MFSVIIEFLAHFFYERIRSGVVLIFKLKYLNEASYFNFIHFSFHYRFHAMHKLHCQ